MATDSPHTSASKSPRHLLPPLTWRSAALALLTTLAALWLLAALTLVALKWIDPPTTAVHAERRIESWFGDKPGDTPNNKPYDPHYTFVPLSRISPDFQHAVIAAEDARFYQHHGFDFHQIQLDAASDLEDHKPHHRIRGASTLTQQLVKNLFFGTGRSIFRKAAETTLVPVAELVLGKQRILELYLNVVEWGPGIYGAEAASRYYFHTSARNLNRHQAAELAAILPAPLHRRPDHMTHYTALIQTRMHQMGW
ncbi:MAG: monofunctional biosynthetic peptidoglycan transglycosylase [Acidobacteriaceae bacterium]